jgi:ADP-ribose pyrophosphatase YjhB (NUDIX family)
MPGGLLEVGETPATGCLRELVEETGVTGRAQRLLGVFDSRLWGYQLQYHLLSFVFLVEHVSGDPHPTPEATEIGYFASDALPPLSAGHEKRVPMMFGLALGQGAGPHFDQ